MPRTIELLPGESFALADGTTVKASYRADMHPIDRPGVRAAITAHLGVSQQTLTNWRTRGVPVERCTAVEVATRGVVKRQELRPADFWKIWPDLPAPAPAQAQPAEAGA